MDFRTARVAAFVVPLAFALAACQELEGTSSPADGTTAGLFQGSARTEVRDVDRPDIFSVTDEGLWDGRPSLGGVWVAHPDVTEPERAKITNTASGQTVAGALFRRERANPGPRIQVSSDAATALGMLAGQPVELSIIVVRQEEFEIEPEPLPLSEEGTEGASEAAVPAETDGTVTATAAAAGALAVSEAAEESSPAGRGFWGRFRDSLRNKPAADIAMEADTVAIAESAAVPDVETAPLDPVATAAAAAIEAAEEVPAPPARSVSSLKNPYIQVGLFSLEANASAASSNLRQAGIVPSVDEQSSDGQTLWRVFVGPVESGEDQAAMLAQIKNLGFQDAFLAPN